MPQTGSTLENLRRKERQVRRDLILDAAVRLFAKVPFKQAGMREIAAEAGISPASIYRYFSDRDELFVEALYRDSKAIVEGMAELVKEETGPELKHFAVSFVDYLLAHDAFFQMMTHFMVNGQISGQTLARFNATESRLLDFFEDRFKQIGSAVKPRLMAHAFFASLNGILITFHNYPGRKPEETHRHMIRLAEILADVFKKGAC